MNVLDFDNRHPNFLLTHHVYNTAALIPCQCYGYVFIFQITVFTVKLCMIQF